MKKTSQDNDRLNLPSKMDIPLSEIDDNDDLLDQICDLVSDYISEKTGFCHKGFEIDIKIKASNIKYDTRD